MPNAWSGVAPENSLRLDEAALSALLNRLDNARSGSSAMRRRHTRWPFRRTRVDVRVDHPGGSSVALRMASRNISLSGISLLHNGFLHTGSGCEVAVPMPDGSVRAMRGTIVRCSKLGGMIHEVGIAFDGPVPLREILLPGYASEFFSLKHVDPASLAGRLVHVEGSSLERRIVAHFLSCTSMEIVTAERVERGVELARTSPCVVLAGMQLADGTGLDVLRRLRDERIRVPVILTTSDLSASSSAAIEAARPEGFLVKPLNANKLLRALGEAELIAASWREREDADLLRRGHMRDEFLVELYEQMAEAERALAAADREALGRVCRRIRGGASTLGFSDLASAADRAERTLADGPDRNVFDELIAAAVELLGGR